MNTFLPAPGASVRGALRTLRRHPWLLILGFLAFFAMLGTFTPDSAFAEDKENGTEPTGFGALFPPTNLADGQKPTLYEHYGNSVYFFDMDPGWTEVDIKVLNGLASVFMFLTTAVVRGAIVLVQSVFSFDSDDALAAAVTGSMGATATELMGWMLPSALALGGLIAYAQSRGGQGGGFGQLLWVFAGGLLAVSFATSPALWTNTLNNARNATAEGIMAAASNSIQVGNKPFVYPDTTYDETNPRNKMLRQSADAIWRSYVATPWCLIEFGSTEACERYGKDLLDQGADADKRVEWIKEDEKKHPGEYNTDAAAFKWILGGNSAERLGMAIIAFLVAAVFGILVIVLSLLSLLAFICAIFLLFAGVFFVMLWCIPGRPRAWGNKWLETVIGLMIQSVIGVLVISGTLVMSAAAFGLAGTKGWGFAAGLSIMVCVAAFTMQRTIAGIIGALTPGMGMTTAIGSAAMRGGAKLLGRAGQAAGRMGWGAAKGAGRRARDAGKALASRHRGGPNPGGRTKGYSSVPPAKPKPGPSGGSKAASGPKTPTGDTGRQTATPPGKPPATETRRPASCRPGTAPASGTAPSHAAESRTDPARPSSDRPRPAASPPAATKRTGGVGDPRLRDNPPPPRRPGRPGGKPQT